MPAPQLVVEIPAVRRPYGFPMAPDFFSKEAKEQGWTPARNLVAQLGTDTAEQDSLFAYKRWSAHPEEFPEGTNWVAFIGKNEVWYVDRLGGELVRSSGSLGDGIRDRCRVARLHK